MATLKSKRKQEVEIENLSKEVEETTSVSPYMTEAEQNALAEQHERDSEESKKVSTAKMERAVEVVSDQFDLLGKDFIVNGFADKGGKCQLSMSNGDFDIVVTVKDSEKFGIV